jgi:hypothetical protein
MLPAEPVVRVQVWGRYLKLDLYPYLSNPYPGTCADLQTHAMH